MTKKIAFLFVGILISFFTAQAQIWTQIGQDIDGEAEGDNSGCSVSLSSDGSIVAIGAWVNDGNGEDAGHVRVYENQEGIWTQIGQDIDGEAEYDWSGGSVSLSSDGTIVAIGASKNNGNGSNSGHVRIYENQIGTWLQIGQDIDGEAQDDWSGGSISLSSNGSMVAIGAVFNDVNGSAAGHVRIYENQNEIWTQIGQDIDGEASGDYFGSSVSLSSDGSIVAIGAPNNDNGSFGSYYGHVRIYENQNGIWTQIGQDINGEGESDNSGTSVSLSSDGSIVAIGAPYNGGNGYWAGHVRIYENQSGNWTQIGQDIDGEAAFDTFGSAVRLSYDGATVVIGAPDSYGISSDTGYVCIYENQSGVWTQIGQDIDGETADNYSGGSVSLNSDGSFVAIGASGDDENGSDAGHVRVFKSPLVKVSEILSIGISIYPNPTTGKINFEFSNKLTSQSAYNIQKLTVSEITGRQIIEKTKIKRNETINLSGFESGIYLLSIQTENEMFTTKIIKR